MGDSYAKNDHCTCGNRGADDRRSGVRWGWRRRWLWPRRPQPWRRLWTPKRPARGSRRLLRAPSPRIRFRSGGRLLASWSLVLGHALVGRPTRRRQVLASNACGVGLALLSNFHEERDYLAGCPSPSSASRRSEAQAERIEYKWLDPLAPVKKHEHRPSLPPASL
jgi:hypothetical protein